MVREDDEMALLQHVTQMLHGPVDGLLMSIVSAVFLRRRVQFLAERM
jgi:hypothetical protein